MELHQVPGRSQRQSRAEVRVRNHAGFEGSNRSNREAVEAVVGRAAVCATMEERRPSDAFAFQIQLGLSLRGRTLRLVLKRPSDSTIRILRRRGDLLRLLVIEIESKRRVVVRPRYSHRQDFPLLPFLEEWVHHFQKKSF